MTTLEASAAAARKTEQGERGKGEGGGGRRRIYARFSTLLPAAVVNKPATRTTIPLKKPKLGFLSRPGHTTTAANQSATPCSCCRRRARLDNHQCAASVALTVSRRNPMRPVLIKPQFASIRLEGLISQRCPSAVRVPLVVDDRARDELEIFAATGWNDWRSSCCCE